MSCNLTCAPSHVINPLHQKLADDKSIAALRRALKLLGINDVYHGFPAFFENPRDCEMWLEAHENKHEARGKPYGRAEFDMLLGHCQAVADHPCCIFAEELILAYPEAKIILTTRPVDDWFRYASVAKTLFICFSTFVDMLSSTTAASATN